MNIERLTTYKVGEEVQLSLHLQDESGVASCYAMFYRLEDPDDLESRDFTNYIQLTGAGHGLKNTVVKLTGTLTHQSPGVYSCFWIETRDVMDNVEKTTDLSPRPTFRVEETPGADLEAPKIVEIGELE